MEIICHTIFLSNIKNMQYFKKFKFLNFFTVNTYLITVNTYLNIPNCISL